MWEGYTVSTMASDWFRFTIYVDNLVLMLARMYQRRLKGYAAFGYVITDAPPRHSPMMSRNENGGDIRQEGFCDSLNSIERGRV
jgi:hypothetical protein